MPLKQTKSVQSQEKNSYDVQVLSSIQEIAAVRLEWEAFLKEHAAKHTFWQDPNVIRLHLETTDHEEPRIILLRRNNKIKCIAPCVIALTRFRISFSIFRLPGPRLRILKILDSDFIFCKDADIDSCVKKVLEVFKNIDTHFDLILLENLEDTSPLTKLFPRTKNYSYNHFQLKITSPKVEYVWRHMFANSYEEWLVSLGKSSRRNIKRTIKNLYKGYPDQIELKRVTKSKDVPKFLDLLDDLFPKTWQAKTFGLRKRNSQRNITFYKNIASQGWLRNYMLLINMQPVAFLIGTQYADIFEGQDCGYDAEFATFGVGATLNYLMIQDLYENDKPAVLNFGFGENAYKKMVCNEKNVACEAYIISPNIWGILVKLQIIFSSIERGIRLFLIKFRLDRTLRRLLKRK